MAEEIMGNSNDTANANNLAFISKLTSPADLVAKKDQVKNQRMKIEREWKLNLAFFKGNQWVFYNRFSGRIESLPVDDGDKPRYRVRLVSNQILPGAQGYVAMLTKTKPVIFATPDSGSDSDIKAAQTAERLYEFWWQQMRLKSKLLEALTWSTIAGSGYWKITWDPQAGSAMTLTMGPDGKPILHPQLKQAYKDALQEQGLAPDAMDKKVYMGDIRIDVLSPFDVFVDPTATSFEDAKWVICKHPMAPDEIKARYKIDVLPDSVAVDADIALPFQNTENKTDPTVKNIYIMYIKPHPAVPKGRIVVFMERPNKILKDDPWYYPTNDLPLVKFGGIRVPGSTIDEALITHARPLQKELNRTLSQIVEHKNLTVRPQMIAPSGSLMQRLTNEPGAVFEYNLVNNAKPEWRDMPALPPYVIEHLREIQARLDRLFNLAQINQGTPPPNVEAGVAIDLLQEASVDQISPVIQRMEEALAQAGHLMVVLAQEYYTEPRLLKIQGEGGSTQVKKFLKADLQGSFSFHAEAGSGLPRSRAGRMARIEQLVNMQILRPDQAAKYLDVADMKGLQAHMAADEDQAYREHDKIVEGQPINVIAQQEAHEAIQQGMNPDTQQPLGPGDDPGTLIKNAGLKPLPWENFQQHMDTHALFMKSVEFESLDPEIQEDFQTHFMQTLQYFRSLPVLPEPQAVRTTVQLKGTLDPGTAAKVMHRSGVIDADPQELSQPPLDTWVTDDQSKTGTDSGNVHLDAAMKMQEMQQAQDKHSLDTAKSVHQMSLAQQQAQHDQEMAQLKLKQDAEKHQAQLQMQQQQHQQQLAQTQAAHEQKLSQQQADHAINQSRAEDMHEVQKKVASRPQPSTATKKKSGGR